MESFVAIRFGIDAEQVAERYALHTGSMGQDFFRDCRSHNYTRESLRSCPGARARVFGNVLARPDRVSLDQAIEETLALRRGRGFRPVARRAPEDRFTGAPTVPVTVGGGSRDRIFPPRQAEVARRVMPAARHVVLDGCGHIPMPDDPALVTAVILETTGQ